jgi:hypothetical protein
MVSAIRIIRLVAAALWIIAFPIWIFSTAVLLRAPLKPDPVTGRIIPWSNHGELHFVTEHDILMDNVSFFTLGGSLLLVMGCTAVGKLLKRRNETP